MDFPIVIIWVSPLSLLGASGVILNFYSIFLMKFLPSKQNSARWDATLCGVTSGAILFAYVHKKGRQAYISKAQQKCLLFDMQPKKCYFNPNVSMLLSACKSCNAPYLTHFFYTKRNSKVKHSNIKIQCTLSNDVVVLQWITSCHTSVMNTRVITLLREYVMSLTTSVTTM